jgi:AraC-like DNA-binding protein
MAKEKEDKELEVSLEEETPSTLQLFLDEITSLTGMRVCLYDLSYFTDETQPLRVPDRLRIHASPFCMHVKSQPLAWKKCIEHELLRAEAAMRDNQPFIHTCHAGITDMVLPLRVGQKLIGALYLGQVVTQSPKQHKRTLRALAARHGFDADTLQQISDAMPHCTTNQLHAKGVVLRFLQEYIEQAQKLSQDEGSDPKNGAPSYLHHTIPIESVPTPLLDKLRPGTAPIQAAVKIIKGAYWTKLDLQSVARRVGQSESHFSRTFKQETGLNFRRVLLETRIDAACYLLKKTELSSTQIAAMLSYHDVASFLRAFKTHRQCTPHEFVHNQTPLLSFRGQH